MTISQYLENINNRYRHGNAPEHTSRGVLLQLIESIVPGVRTTIEPKSKHCGAADYILTKKEIPVGFIEATDIDVSELPG